MIIVISLSLCQSSSPFHCICFLFSFEDWEWKSGCGGVHLCSKVKPPHQVCLGTSGSWAAVGWLLVWHCLFFFFFPKCCDEQNRNEEYFWNLKKKEKIILEKYNTIPTTTAYVPSACAFCVCIQSFECSVTFCKQWLTEIHLYIQNITKCNFIFKSYLKQWSRNSNAVEGIGH